MIFPGNSGGPLVNKHGEIIGINEVGIGSLGGAIPANLAQTVSNELAEKGYVSRSWTGLECQPMLNHDIEGLLVSGVIKNSPAKNSGILPGDIIKNFDGVEVKARIPEDLPIFNKIAYSRKPGREIKISGLRNGKRKVWNLTPIVRESAFAKEVELRNWGLTVRDLTLMSSLEAQRTSKRCTSYSVNPGGPSSGSKPALRVGDVITSINNNSIFALKI